MFKRKKEKLSYEASIKIIGIAINKKQLPDKFALHQNYPNPFNPSAKIEFDLPVSGNVKLEVYNSVGQIILTLVDGFRDAGY